ncbi:twin-arginine translocation signal domain-containing protein [Zobellia nedashkovskayae]
MKNSRRNFIKQSAFASAALTVPTYSFGIINKPKFSEQIIGHGDFTYRVHKEWGNLKSCKYASKKLP